MGQGANSLRISKSVKQTTSYAGNYFNSQQKCQKFILVQYHILTRILMGRQRHNHCALITSLCLVTGWPNISEEEIEIFSKTKTQRISKKSNLGHQEHPHPLCVYHIINYQVSGSQILSPIKSPIYTDNYPKAKVHLADTHTKSNTTNIGFQKIHRL